jgi:hypothetical protein
MHDRVRGHGADVALERPAMRDNAGQIGQEFTADGQTDHCDALG